MIRNYFKIAFRSIWKNRAFSILNTLGLAIAMAVALIIFLYLANEINTDKFHKNRDNIYLVSVGEYYSTPALLLKTVGQNIPGLEGKLRLWHSDQTTKIGNDKIKFETIFADSAFFTFFDFNFVYGDKSNAIKNKGQIVLTESLAKKLYGTTDVIGKTIDMGRPTSSKVYSYVITGILEDAPNNSSIKFEAITNYYGLENIFGNDFENDFNEWSYASFLLLNKKTNLQNFKEAFDKQLIDLFLENDKEATIEDFEDEKLSDLTRFSSLYFDQPEIHLFNVGNKQMLYIYLSIALFILLIAAVNYINLSTAISLKRNKETGVRIVFGARIKQLISKFIIESIIITFLAFMLACIITEFALPAINSYIPNQPDFHLFDNIGLLSIFIMGSILFGILNGLFPAFYLSKVDTARILKGEFVKGKKADKLRSGLIVFQFIIAAVLITFTVTVFMQLSHLKNMDLGFQQENIIKIPLNLNIQDKKEVLKDEVLNFPFVKKAAIARGIPGEIGMTWGRDFNDENITFVAMPVDLDLISLLKMEILQGRDFIKGDKNGAYIVNETLAKKMDVENPINEQIDSDPVVGVVKNFNFRSARHHVGPMAMYYSEVSFSYRNYLLVELMPGTTPVKINEMKDLWDSFSSDFPFNYAYLDQSLVKLYSEEKKFGDLFTLFSIMAIFIVCIGLFGLSAFVVKQKTKEIGIRKVLGAFSNNILSLLSRKFLLLAIIANVISIPLAWYFLEIWLANFANRIGIPLYAFIVSFILSIVITIITVSWQSIKAIRMNPVEAIKYE